MSLVRYNQCYGGPSAPEPDETPRRRAAHHDCRRNRHRRRARRGGSKVGGDAGNPGRPVPRHHGRAATARAATARTATARTATAKSATRPFSLLGISWTDPRATLAGAIHVRTRKIGAIGWTPWQTVEADGPRPVTSAVDRSALGRPVRRGRGPDRRRTALPAGLRIDLINPETPNHSPAYGGKRVESTALPTRPVPKMVTRAGWGANESIVRAAPSYTGADRGLLRPPHRHRQRLLLRRLAGHRPRHPGVPGAAQGLDDIGYNFLVDKCGTIFEGRGGGVAATCSARTHGLQHQRQRDRGDRQLRLGRRLPRGPHRDRHRRRLQTRRGRQQPGGQGRLRLRGSNKWAKGRPVRSSRISGHRDAGLTDCPGDALYRQIPPIRAIAGAAPAGLRLVRMPGAIKYGPLLYTKGRSTRSGRRHPELADRPLRGLGRRPPHPGRAGHRTAPPRSA